MRTMIEAVAPWILPAVPGILDAANLVPPPPLSVYVLTCAVAITLTLKVIVRCEIAAMARRVPVAAAMERGYELAREHCLADRGEGRHRPAVGETTSFASGLHLVPDVGTVYRSANAADALTEATAPHPVVPLRRPGDLPRPRRQDRTN